MKVFLGGTVNGSSWRDYIIKNLSIAYFNPVVKDWKPEDLERELYERRHCNYCLYVITPKMTGYYSLAEVVDDSVKRPDRTIYCFLHEDGGDKFSDADIQVLTDIGRQVENNGATVCANLDDIVEFLNNSESKRSFTGASPDYLNNTIDAYISYGRNDSKELTEDIAETLRSNKLKNWFDTDIIPQEIEFLDSINTLIRNAHCFIFVVSEHSSNSEYCLRELEYARELGKHIVFIVAEESTNNLIDDIKPNIHINWSTQAERLSSHLAGILQQLAPQTTWLRHLQQWIEDSRNDDHLLYGSNRSLASRWLETGDKTTKLYRISDELRNYIKLSQNQAFTTRCMYQLNQATKKMIQHPWFDRVIGYTAIANPLALLPQAWVLLNANNSEAISVSMWLIFLALQLTGALYAIKHRNFVLFLAQFFSMLITAFIISLAIIKA